MEIPRFLFVHAHPDDETLTTGATIAHYAARGARVHVVTCTLGEEGEVIGERWARLAVDGADQLGGYRIGELSAALRELGVAEPTFLGGAGRWRDSGMAGTPPRGRQRFVDADPREAVGALVAIIRELRPHVVVSYDPNGGYGHPDHIHAHRVTAAAVAAAGGSDYPGDPWSVPKFYWTVIGPQRDGGRRSRTLRDGPACGLEPVAHVRRSSSATTTTRSTPSSPHPRVGRPRSPPSVRTRPRSPWSPTGRACALSNFVALPIAVTEHYVLAAGAAGERDDRGWETDLLAGLNLG